MAEGCLIDGFGPVPVERPDSIAELSALVRKAAAQGQAIYPVGGRTMLDLGMPPSKPGWAIDLGGLNQVIDYPSRDMTITVQAGLTVSRLQEILAPENQRLPIDVPDAGRATLGGILAANVSGPRRFGYGTLRDYLLGISAINDEGNEFKAGGRVVKNVAGYDLCKLLVGSLGTLGIITQVTLKLRPLPEAQALITLSSSSDNVEPILESLQHSRTRPICIDVMNPAAARSLPENATAGAEENWAIVIGYDGNVEAVQWQVQQLIQEVHGRCTLTACLDGTCRSLEHVLIEFPGHGAPLVGSDGPGLTFKANLLPSGTGAFCRLVNALPDRPVLQAHAGNGIVVAHVDPGLTCDRAAALLTELRKLAGDYQGRVVVLRCPPGWKEAVSVWGLEPGCGWLMREIKGRFDPHGLFNPGRFLAGL
jgi:glycolate oxidase FAD binding subunit